jgi:hypothetical protein
VNRARLLSTLSAAMMALVIVASSAYADQPVRVTNTNANPIPVNGNVIVSGTANVNVTKPVIIGNTLPIPVTLVGTSPVPVVENPARSPFMESLSLSIPASTLMGIEPFPPIPAGTRLAVDLVSVSCDSAAGTFPALAIITLDQFGFAVPLQYQGLIETVGRQWNVGNLNGGFFVDANNTMSLFVQKSNTTGDTTCYVSLSGHLVTL